MTVEDLIEELKGMPQNAPVYVQGDGEFEPVWEADHVYYDDEAEDEEGRPLPPFVNIVSLGGKTL